jgi:ribosome-associated translation inhibitor RaiA
MQQLSIRTRSIEITDRLRDLISRRLHFALDVFGDRIGHASVYLADINGPRGGVDKRCQIAVAIRGAGNTLVRGEASTSEAALTYATRRLKYLVSEALKQAQRPATDSIRRMATVA